MEIDLPREMPVMTLPGLVFFPHALLPLHIFEPRYRRMLADVLHARRIFAVAQLDAKRSTAGPDREPMHRIATAGIVRACQKNENGTSNLLLQGLCRISIESVSTEEPYRRVLVEPLESSTTAPAEELAELREQAVQLLDAKRRLGASVPEEIAGLVKSVADPEVFSHLAAFALFEHAGFKQKLLEIDDTAERLRRLGRRLTRDIRNTHLQRQLQGDLPNDDIPRN